MTIQQTDESTQTINKDAGQDVVDKGSESVEETILTVKHAGLLRRLFPDEMQREYARKQLEIVKTELEFRRRALEIMRNGQTEVLRKRVDSWASVAGIEIDADKERHIRDLMSQRERDVNVSVEDFQKDYDQAVTRAEAMKEGRVKDKELERLDRVLISFYEKIEYFDKQFMESVQYSS